MDILTILIVAVFGISQANASIKLQDFSKINFSSDKYIEYIPKNSKDIIKIVKVAISQKKKIRIRGSNHSLNGSSLPNDNEILVSTQNLNLVKRISNDLIWVQSGVVLGELKKFLNSEGLELFVLNDGFPGPTVGGFISAGGASYTSEQVGGFWETIKEINLINGEGEIKVIKNTDQDFPWFFGSMGQLGIIESVIMKVKKIKGVKGNFSIGKTVEIPNKIKIDTSSLLLWWNMHLLPADEPKAKIILENLKKSFPEVIPKNAVIYHSKIKKISFIPPLLFSQNKSFLRYGIFFPNTNLNENKEAIFKIEETFMRDIMKNNLERYIQADLTSTPEKYKAYFRKNIYEGFYKIKSKYDPNFLFNYKTVF